MDRMALAEMMSLGKRMDEHMSLTEAEEYKKQLLTEMAYERKVFKALITYLSQQVIENWCLVRYGRLCNMDEGRINHWKTELITHLAKVANNKLKKNNSIKARTKAINEVWVDEKEYATDANAINLAIYGKFLSEKLNINKDIYYQAINDCKAASADIVSAIASQSIDAITEYVRTL